MASLHKTRPDVTALHKSGRQVVKTKRFRRLPGVLFQFEFVSCGKKACRRCARGPAHGPYWYRYEWRAGRMVSRYVGRKLQPSAEEQSNEHG